MRGGPRQGAGRKPGVPNKASIERQAEIAASGLTPLDFMMDVLRDETRPFEARMEAAKSAAPYVHPRLSNIDVSANVTTTHEDFLDSLAEPEGEAPAAEG